MSKLSSGYWNIYDPINGFTAIKCEILKKINLNSSGYIDISTQLSPEETFFEKHGNTSILLIILFLGLLFYLIEFLISLKRYN